MPSQKEILEATHWIKKSVDVYECDENDNRKDKPISEVEKEVDEFINFIRNRKKYIEKRDNKKILWNFRLSNARPVAIDSYLNRYGLYGHDRCYSRNSLNGRNSCYCCRCGSIRGSLRRS